jgi:Zn-dependent protease
MLFGIDIIDNIARIIVLLFVLTLHEFAHAFVAYKSGDSTAKAAGRLSLNPIRHFDGPGFLMLLFLPIGYAKPVPINPYNFRRRRRNYLAVALAGVTVNFAIAFVMSLPYVAYHLFGNQDFIYNNSFGVFFSKVLEYFIIIDLSLMFFNLLPVFPLDGFRVVECFTSTRNKFRRFMQQYGTYILITLFIVSVLEYYAFTYIPELPYWLHYFDILGYWLSRLINLISGLLIDMWFYILVWLDKLINPGSGSFIDAWLSISVLSV